MAPSRKPYRNAAALEHGAMLVSADRGFGRFAGLEWLEPTG
jgi:predicted nucleic acid-binding protein